MSGQRQAQPITLTTAPGIFMQRSKRQSQGRYIDGDNVRWYQGNPQKMGGYLEQTFVDSDGKPTRIIGHVRAVKQWDSLDGQVWIAIGTEYKLYLINNSILYDITPIRQVSSPVDPFTTQAGSIVITVVDPRHGASPGDFVLYSGTSPIGNVDLEGEWQVATIIDLDTYTINYTVPASSSATGGGAVQAQYEWTSGLTDATALTGFGVGPYGEEAYGTPRTGSTFLGQPRIWSLDNWGEDLLAAPNGEALFWWKRQTGPQSRAVIRPTAPANIEYMLVGPDDRHVIALGTNLLSQDQTTVGGQQDRMFVRWCEGDDFDTWVEAQTNDAGSKRLDQGSRLITAVKTRTSIVIFSDEALYSVGLVGGTDVYSIIPLDSQGVTIISANAGADVLGTVFFMGQHGFFTYNGTLNPLPCDLMDYVFGGAGEVGINRSQQAKVTCRIREDFTEVLWSFPSQNSDENDSTVIYNWTTQCWYKSSINREHGLDTNSYYGTPVGFNDTAMYLEETGTDVDTEEGLYNFLQTWEGEVQSYGQQKSQSDMSYQNSSGADVMALHKLYLDFDSLAGSLYFQCIGRDRSNDPTVYGERVAFDGTRVVGGSKSILEPRFRQRRVSVHFEGVDMGVFWRMDMMDGVAVPLGRRV